MLLLSAATPRAAHAEGAFVEALEPKSQHVTPVEGHRLEVGIRTSLRNTLGSFDPYGYYTPYPSGVNSWGTLSIISGSYRLDRHWELSTDLIFSHSWSDSATGDSSSYSFGSPAFELRYHVTPSESFWKTHWILSAGYTLPNHWGVKTQNGDPMSSVDSSDANGDLFTGQSWNVAASVSRQFGQLRVALGSEAIFPLAQGVVPSGSPDGTPASAVRRGTQYLAKEGLTWIFSPAWSVSGGFKQEWGMETTINDQIADGTASRRFLTITGVAYQPVPDWRLGLSAETPFPFYDYMVNKPYSPSVAVSATYFAL